MIDGNIKDTKITDTNELIALVAEHREAAAVKDEPMNEPTFTRKTKMQDAGWEKALIDGDYGIVKVCINLGIRKLGDLCDVVDATNPYSQQYIKLTKLKKQLAATSPMGIQRWASILNITRYITNIADPVADEAVIEVPAVVVKPKQGTDEGPELLPIPKGLTESKRNTLKKKNTALVKIREGYKTSEVTRMTGIGTSTFFNWQARDPEYKRLVDLAVASCKPRPEPEPQSPNSIPQVAIMPGATPQAIKRINTQNQLLLLLAEGKAVVDAEGEMGLRRDIHFNWRIRYQEYKDASDKIKASQKPEPDTGADAQAAREAHEIVKGEDNADFRHDEVPYIPDDSEPTEEDAAADALMASPVDGMTRCCRKRLDELLTGDSPLVEELRRTTLPTAEGVRAVEQAIGLPKYIEEVPVVNNYGPPAGFKLIPEDHRDLDAILENVLCDENYPIVLYVDDEGETSTHALHPKLGRVLQDYLATGYFGTTMGEVMSILIARAVIEMKNIK